MMIMNKVMALIVPSIMLANQASAYDVNLNSGLPRHNALPQNYEISEAPEVVAPEENGEDGRTGSEPRCVSDTEGFFGDSTDNGLSLEYYYELDHDTTILPRVNELVLKFLQNKISDLILPVLFVRACSSSRRVLDERLRRRLEVIGISALPDDVVLPGGTFG
jgi:hypothetical protein